MITAKQYHDLDTPERQARIAAIKAEAPEDSHFEGFGGSTIALETLVFNVSRRAPALHSWLPYSFEVRIPVFPSQWADDLNDVTSAIEEAYGCIALLDWGELADAIAIYHVGLAEKAQPI